MFLHTKAVDKCWMVFATLLVGIQNCWCRANLRHGRRPFNILWEYLWNVQLQLLVLVAPSTRRKVTLSLEWFVTVHNGLCADVPFFYWGTFDMGIYDHNIIIFNNFKKSISIMGIFAMKQALSEISIYQSTIKLDSNWKDCDISPQNQKDFFGIHFKNGCVEI